MYAKEKISGADSGLSGVSADGVKIAIQQHWQSVDASDGSDKGRGDRGDNATKN